MTPPFPNRWAARQRAVLLAVLCGITGDTLGATVEVVEAVVLVTAASRL